MGVRVRRWAAALALSVTAVVAAAGGGVLWLVGTDAGRDRTLRLVLAALEDVFDGRGRLVAGRLVSATPGAIELHDVRLVDSVGAPVLTIARVRGAVATGDLWRGVVRLPRVTLDTVHLDLRQAPGGPVNLAYLLAGDTLDRPTPRPGRRLGDDVRIDRLMLHAATVDAQLPWAPHPLFATAAERDSVIAARDSLHELIRTPDGGLLERRVVAIAHLAARDLQVVTPDNAPGSLTIDSAALTVSDPPVRVRQLRGALRWYDDSLTFQAPEVRLPASRLAARGALDWGQPGALRYDIVIEAPEVSLADIGWTWPVLPTEGTARASVRLRTLEDADHLEVRLRSLEAEALASRITGELTLVAEVRDLLLRDVALAFTPLTTALAARLTEDALPPELDGRLTGRFVAREGGSLSALRIDTLQLTFDDALVPGARSRLRASGVVALGVAPAARDVRLQDVSLDLRSVRVVAPDLPPIANGMVSGSARLAAASLHAADVRDLALAWRDQAGHVSAISGAASVRWAGGPRRATLALDVAALDLGAVARVDTAFALRGVLRGALSATGALDSLPFQLWLGQQREGEGTVTLDGWAGLVDGAAGSVTWRADVDATLDALDLEPWLRPGRSPATRLDGRVGLFVAGVDSLLDTARVDVGLRQTAAARRTPFSLFSLATWGQEALLVDSLRGDMPGVVFEASGGLARDSLGRASFRGALQVDTLDAVRRELPRLAEMVAAVDTSAARALRQTAADSLAGALTMSLYGEGSFANYMVSVATAAQRVQVGAVAAGRLFGSVRADNLPGAARFVAAATADSVEGIGALRIATANFGIDRATPAEGALRFDLLARDTSRLRLRGRFARGDDTLLVDVDTVRFTYDQVLWANVSPLRLRNRPAGFAIDSFALRSNRGGSLQLGADVPLEAPMHAYLRLDRFPAGELAAFALGTQRLPGLLTGSASLSGVREDPQVTARILADSLGTATATLSGVRVEVDYAAQQLDARVLLADTAGRALRAELTLPADLRLQEVIGDRVYTEALSGVIVADSLRLRDLPLRIQDVRDLDGVLHGRFALTGTFDQPDFDGRMRLDEGTLFSEVLGIRPREAALDVVAGGDSLHVAAFRFRSGPRAGDTLHLTATVRRPLRDGPGLSLRASLNTLELARQRDGTDVTLSGRLQLSGPLERPVATADLFVPRANLVLDLTEARTVLDLASAEAQALLAPNELPASLATGGSFGAVGEFLEARDVRVRLGDDVWVRTREAAVQLSGEVNVLEAAGQQISLDGEVLVERGTYRLDLGVVNRPFTVDSGRVRFFPRDALNPALDVHATHVVRGVDGRDVPINVAIGGTLETPTLALGTTDDAYANAPESEFISLLVFGAPTFALDGQRQQTVRAVTGMLVTTLSTSVEGTLQRLLPVFNTVQVTTAGGQQRSDDPATLASLLDNVSVTAGKQIGRRTFLRFDTGICRGLAANAGAGALNLWYGIATEYRIAPGLTGQVGVDPGPSPCGARLGGSAPRMQVGFDLFKGWVF